MPKKLHKPRTPKIAEKRAALTKTRLDRWKAKTIRRKAQAEKRARDKIMAAAAEHIQRVSTLTVDDLAVVSAKLDAYRRDILWDRPHLTARHDKANFEPIEAQAADASIMAKTSRNVAGDTVEKMYARGEISQRQYSAAYCLRHDDEVSGSNGLKAMPYDGDRIQGGAMPGTLSDRAIDAQRRKMMCFDRLGAVGMHVVRSVVLEYYPLKEVADRLAWKPTYRGPRLAEALDTVADFYRI